jgi:hypothetical protein
MSAPVVHKLEWWPDSSPLPTCVVCGTAIPVGSKYRVARDRTRDVLTMVCLPCGENVGTAPKTEPALPAPAPRQKAPKPAPKRPGPQAALPVAPCPICGTPFKVRSSGPGRPRRATCSQPCGRKLLAERLARASKRWATEHERCVICGTTERPHMARGHCTRCYQRVRTPNVEPTACAWCKETFIAPMSHSRRQETCSLRCARLLQGARKAIYRCCPGCGETFRVKRWQPRQETCSLSCAQRWLWRRKREEVAS